MVEQRFASSHRDASLEQVLYYAIGVELTQSGLSTTQSPGEAAYVLKTVYEQDTGVLSLGLTLFRVPDLLHALASVDAPVTADDSLDSQIGLAVRRLVRLARLGPGESPDAKIEGVFPETAVRASPPAGGSGSFRSPPVEYPPPRGTGVPAAGDRPLLRLGASAGGTAFLGKLSDVAHYGATGSAKAGLVWFEDSWSLLAGVRLSETRVFNDAGVTGGPLYFSGAALTAELGTGKRQPYSVTGGISAGPMVLTVAGSPSRSKTVLWAEAVAGAGFPVGWDVLLGGEVRYFTAFETTLIQGLTAALTVSRDF